MCIPEENISKTSSYNEKENGRVEERNQRNGSIVIDKYINKD